MASPGTPRFGFRQAHSTERRIDEQSVDRDPIADLAIRALEEIIGHDLVVVVGRVREAGPAVAIPERVDVGSAGRQRLAHRQ